MHVTNKLNVSNLFSVKLITWMSVSHSYFGIFVIFYVKSRQANHDYLILMSMSYAKPTSVDNVARVGKWTILFLSLVGGPSGLGTRNI